MPISTPTFKPVASTTTIIKPDKVKITNFDILIANIEYSHSLQNNLSQLLVKNREMAITKLCFINGNSNIEYVTIYPGCIFSLDEINFSGNSIYFQSNKICKLEIVELYN